MLVTVQVFALRGCESIHEKQIIHHEDHEGHEENTE